MNAMEASNGILAAPAVGAIDRPLFAVEHGQVASIRRVCRLRLGLPAEETAPQANALMPWAGGQPGGAANFGAPQGLLLPPGPPVLPPRKIKLSSVIDQTDDAEIYVWDSG